MVSPITSLCKRSERKKFISKQRNKRQSEDICQTPNVHISFDLAWPFQQGSKQLILMITKIKKKNLRIHKGFFFNGDFKTCEPKSQTKLRIT